MTALNKQALRGQSVEGSFYLAECGHCGEMYPSNKLDGGEPLFSGDYGECYCHLCGADDSDIADNGAWGSEAVSAWNYQQKRIEALLDELEGEKGRTKELEAQRALAFTACNRWADKFRESESKLESAEKRIAELEREPIATLDVQSGRADGNKFALVYSSAAHKLPDDVYYLCVAAAGIGVKGE
ncbi:TPA: ead/Ea22-like family protein [Citrobacter freundii]